MYSTRIKKQDIQDKGFRKSLLSLWYLYSQEKRNGDININLKDLITYSKQTVSNNKKGTKYKYIDILNTLKQKQYINISNDLNNIQNNTTLNLRFVKEDNNYKCFNNKTDYVCLADTEVNTILQYYDNNKTSCKAEDVLSIYLLIKSFMYMSTEYDPFCTASMAKLCYYADMTENSVRDIIKVLVNMKMIYKYKIKKNNNTKTINVYTLKPEKVEYLMNHVLVNIVT